MSGCDVLNTCDCLLRLFAALADGWPSQAEDKVEALTKELLSTKSDLVEADDEKRRLTQEALLVSDVTRSDD